MVKIIQVFSTEIDPLKNAHHLHLHHLIYHHHHHYLQPSRVRTW